jgi:hypothetical protein
LEFEEFQKEIFTRTSGFVVCGQHGKIVTQGFFWLEIKMFT